MDRVCEDHAPIIVTRKASSSVVMMSLEDYEALEETSYLLRSPKNAGGSSSRSQSWAAAAGPRGASPSEGRLLGACVGGLPLLAEDRPQGGPADQRRSSETSSERRSRAIGKPEPLKHALSGYWSRRITDEHRIVYKVEGDAILVAQLRYHY